MADDFYHKYKEDIAMIKKLGFKHFRMSFSWSRILPLGTIEGGINQKGVDFYMNVIDEFIANGITPWVTLYHWDLPSALNDKSDKGGWLNDGISDVFADYADFCFKTYGGKVKRWLTLNEPWTYTWLGYGAGVHAPGRCSSDECKRIGGGGNTGTEPYIVAHNSILAHAKAVNVYRTKYQKEQGGEIGFTTNTNFALPYNPNSEDDIWAANVNIAFNFGWYVDPIVFGKYPDEMSRNILDGRLPTFTEEQKKLVKGSFDFIGLNHYTSSFVKKVDNQGGDWGSDSHTAASAKDVFGNLIGPYAESAWLNVYPEGMRGILNWIAQRYDNQKIYVFENGCSVPKENDMPLEQAVHD